MTTETMTIHKALSELKTLDSRINTIINSSVFVMANKHSNEKIQGKTISEIKDSMKSSYQKINDLISRRNALKRAVVLSNAITKVNINGTEYTVAEAIELKNHGMELKKNLLNNMVLQYKEVQHTLGVNSGDTLERRAEIFIQNTLAAQPKDSKMALATEAMQSLRKAYIENNTYDLIDSIGIDKIIENLTEEINNFMTEVDSALSVSNALTTIEFNY